LLDGLRSVGKMIEDRLEDLPCPPDRVLPSGRAGESAGPGRSFPGNARCSTVRCCSNGGFQRLPNRGAHPSATGADPEESACRILEYLDLDLLPRHPKCVERTLDGLVDAPPLGFHRPHRRAPPLSDLSMYHCCAMLRRLFTSQ